MKFIIGIDEAGRGPLAGPVSIGAFKAKKEMGRWLLKNVFQNKLRDSKKLSSQKREEIYKKFLILKKEGKIYFTVSHISNKIIDKEGITYATKLGIKKCLNSIEFSDNEKVMGGVFLRLDGLLKAPIKFENQETIIKGDEKDVFIACASIVAKVSRDNFMKVLTKKYPSYGFEIHKGYGTTLHYRFLKKFGLSDAHRKTFCKNLL